MDVPFPMLTAPGQAPQVAGGRLVNCYPETLPKTAGKPYAYWRVAGLSAWGTAPGGLYRGGIFVAGTFYAAVGNTVYTYPSIGGPGTPLPNTLPGSANVFFAANQAQPPQIVCVVPGTGAFVIDPSTGVGTYPTGSGGAVIGQPNSVVYHQSFFIFTYGNGKTQASDPNSLNINALNYATAESKPDALYRALPLGNGQLLLAGAATIEVWGNENDTGYPFSWISTIYRGIVGLYAIAGNEDGWGKGIYFVGDDNKVSTLTTYTPTPVSTPDIDQLIEREPDKTKITVGVYVARGHGMVVVQAPTWCWEYDTTLLSWHERQSYLQTWWRGTQPIQLGFSPNPFWVCGDQKGPNLLKIDGSVRNEVGDPLRMRIETGPLQTFPNLIRVNEIELYMTKGASIATGHDPDETNAMVSISMSRDGGQTFGNPRNVALGRQSVTALRARAGIWGQADVQGVRWRFDESAGLNFAFMGADMMMDKLR
jgi:hypothetical protein